MPEPDAAAASSARRERAKRRSQRSNAVVLALIAAAGVGGALAGTHATGTPVVDPVYGAVTAGLVTMVASRASRETLLFLAVMGAALSRGWVLVPGVGGLAVAFGSIWTRRHRRLGALTGAISVQAVLRWHSVGFSGLTLLLGMFAIAPAAIYTYRRLDARARRRAVGIGVTATGGLVVLAVPLAVGIVMSRHVVSRAVTATQLALTGASDGNSASLTGQLRTATADFAIANHRLAAWWTLGSRLVPIAAQHGRAVGLATATAGQLTAASARAATSVDYRNLSYQRGSIDLARLSAMAQPLGRLDQQFVAAHRELISLHSPWLLAAVQSRLGQLDTKLQRARTSVELANQAAQVVPGILGADGPRHYFVAFTTPAESRGLGGFIGSFGELVADHGHVTLSRSGPIADLQQVPVGTRHISGPADYLARYGGFRPQDLFQDLTYSPDFPSVADVIAQMYPQSGGDPIDGVLAVDPAGLGALLSFTGPIVLPGLPEPLTSANAAQVLLKDQYPLLEQGTSSTARHDLLQEAVALAFPKLLAGSLPGPRAIGQSLSPAVRQGRLLFWSSHAADQPVLRRLGLDGSATPTGPGDYLAVTTQNGANNKIDAYLERTIDDQVMVDPATGHVTARVTIALHNRAPTSGLPPIVLGSFASSGLPPGTNRTWLSLYTPFGLTAATVDGTAKSLSSVVELGVNAFSGFVDVGAGKTVTISVSLSGQVPSGTVYHQQVHRQPLANPEHLTVTVTPTPGWVGVATWIPDVDQRQEHAFRFQRTK